MTRLFTETDIKSSAVATISLWAPADLGAQLASHWSADDHGTANMTDDPPVSAWKGRVSAINATAVTTARPPWAATSFNSAVAGVSFAGSLNVLGTPTGIAALPVGSTTGYIFIVASQTALAADTGARYFGGYGASGANQGRQVLRTVVSGVNRLQITTLSGTPLIDTLVDLSGNHMILAGFDSTGLSGWINGTPTTPATVVTGAPATITTRIRLGADAGTTATLFHQGVIRHWIVVTGALSADNIAKLFGWAAWDSGLQANLPAGYPYKLAPPTTWTPYTGAAIDMDFVAQKYWWGGTEKTTADFTTYALNGSTFDATGLTPTGTIDVSLSLAGLGTFVPGAIAFAVTMTGSPASGKHYGGLDDGTTNERLSLVEATTPSLSIQMYDGGVVQANIPMVWVTALATRHGAALSYATNDVKVAGNGTPGTADVVATMPTVTTLRIGRLITSNTQPIGAIARVVVFTSVKTQAELNALSIALRDNVVT